MAEAVYAEKALAPTQSLKEAAAVGDQIKNTATSGKNAAVASCGHRTFSDW
jgi:hypothetical protein